MLFSFVLYIYVVFHLLFLNSIIFTHLFQNPLYIILSQIFLVFTFLVFQMFFTLLFIPVVFVDIFFRCGIFPLYSFIFLYFPAATCFLLSLISSTIVLNFFLEIIVSLNLFFIQTNDDLLLIEQCSIVSFILF